MITNDRQYKITRSQLVKFQEAIDQFDLKSSKFENIHPKLIRAEKLALEIQIKQFTKLLKEYEDLKEGRVLVTEVKSLSDLPLAIIRSRIANGLTQGELANKLGMAEQQIQRYESDKYDSASVKILIKVADALGVRIDADVHLKVVEDVPEYLDVKNYPFKQMLQRKWFPNFTGTFNEAMGQSKEMLSTLFETAGMANLRTGLNKQTVRQGTPF